MTIQGIILSIAYAMAAFMIRSLYPNEGEATIGRLTGLLVQPHLLIRGHTVLICHFSAPPPGGKVRSSMTKLSTLLSDFECCWLVHAP